MSITDELREYAGNFYLFRYKDVREKLDAIADRIDEAHEKAMSSAGQLLADAENDRDYNYANWQECKQKVLQHNITIDELDARIECLEDELSHCIELPKDADDEYIHIGDSMECLLDGAKTVLLVGYMTYRSDGWHIALTIEESYRFQSYAPKELHHYHEPTVEDTLREFAHVGIRIGAKDGIKAGEIDFYADEEAIAEYAPKLRLAGDASPREPDGAAPVIVSDSDTDGATGYCRCGACGGAIDPWDHFCRHCGTEVQQ